MRRAKAASSAGGRVGMPSATFEPEPTETNIVLPSGEKAMSRVQWPRPAGSDGTTTSAGPDAVRSPLIGKAHDRVGLGDIDVARVRPRRIEGDAERAVEAGGEDVATSRLGRAVGGAEDADAPGAALGDENVAVRRDAHDARLVETRGEQADGEARRRLRHGAGGPRDDPRRIGGRARAPGAGRSAAVNLAANARRVGAPIAIGGGAGARRAVVGERRRATSGRQQAGRRREGACRRLLAARRGAAAKAPACAQAGHGLRSQVGGGGAEVTATAGRSHGSDRISRLSRNVRPARRRAQPALVCASLTTRLAVPGRPSPRSSGRRRG